VNREIKLEILSSVGAESVHRVTSIGIVLSEDVVAASFKVEDLGSSLVLRRYVMPTGRRSYIKGTV
jgi:hypothetical protein